MSRTCAAFAVGLLACAVLVGCGPKGPELGEVKGQVTMDGKPLPNVLVTFTPVEGGRAATATTDASGQYQLIYSDRKGTTLGQHRVTITTLATPVASEAQPMSEEEYQKQAMGGQDPSAYDSATVNEPIPARYNTNTELVKEVTSGANEINFELTSS